MQASAEEEEADHLVERECDINNHNNRNPTGKNQYNCRTSEPRPEAVFATQIRQHLKTTPVYKNS
jgi:hypothetical protein